MADADERDEYVMNDHGRLWVGSPHSSRPWYFAQFHEECYEVTRNATIQLAPDLMFLDAFSHLYV